jgi:hypothetical protein
LAGAIAIALGLYVIVGFGLGASVYWLMQPRVIANAGIVAYRPPPRTVIDHAPARVPPPPPPTPVEDTPVAAAPREPEAVAVKVGESQPTLPKQQASKSHAAASRRARRPAQRRDPMRDFAYQPSFGFRPWF